MASVGLSNSQVVEILDTVAIKGGGSAACRKAALPVLVTPPGGGVGPTALAEGDADEDHEPGEKACATRDNAISVKMETRPGQSHHQSPDQ